MADILIYGASGYTGRLIVEECIRKGIQPLIAGRNREQVQALAESNGLEYRVFSLSDTNALHEFLSLGKVVIHCAGPFVHTAKAMVEACLHTGTHYMDITGEYQVFDLVQSYDGQAKERGIMLLPGAGFDVVPSDCLAAHLHEQLPDATELVLAFVTKGGGLSRGTTKTMIENLGQPQMIRKNGVYLGVPMGSMTRLVDYGGFEQVSMGISWGDISTAYFSTGIPNIRVLAGAHPAQIRQVQRLQKIGFLFRWKPVKRWLQRNVDKKPAGPNEEKRQKSSTYLWGQVSNGRISKEARLKVPNGYTLTAESAVHIATRIVHGDCKAGYQTPSSAYGAGLILQMEGCALH